MLMQNILLYGILLLAAIGAVVGWANAKKGASWGQPLTVVCAIIAIVLGLVLAVRNSTGSAAQSAAMKRENTYRRAKIVMFADEILKVAAGKKAYVIVDPGTDTSKDIECLTLKEKFADLEFLAPEAPKNTQVGPDGSPEVMIEPMEEWFSSKMLDELLKGKNPELVIFMVSMPRNMAFAKNQFKSAELKKAKVAICYGGVYGLAPLLNSGAICVALSSSPTAVYDDKPAPKDLKEAFDKRYILITKDNLKDYISKNADMFGINQ